MARPIPKATRLRLAQLAEEYAEADELIVEARSWLLDCFGHDEDAAEYIEIMSVYEVILAVERYYDGGWEHFVELSLPA